MDDTVWCLKVNCKGEIPYAMDGGEFGWTTDDGEGRCPECGTVYKQIGLDWEVTHVYIQPAVKQDGGA